MDQISRRTFIQEAGQGLAASAAVATLARTAKAEPGRRLRHAIIGCGGMARRHAAGFSSFADVEVVALCDVDPERFAQVEEQLPAGSKPVRFDDFRRLLEDQNIDSVSVTTPDHWHTPVAIAALNAGKNVYVEKPCCHTIAEGRLLARTAEQSGKCVQHGTQARSAEGIRTAVAFLREGRIGKVRFAKAINHQLRGPIGREPETEPPPGANYDLWLGPAPVHAFTKNRWHYNWHWCWDYGCGDLGNDGIHQVDQARWGLGAGLPKAVSASGGQLFYDDDHETPDTQVVTFEYDTCYLVYEMRLWTDYPLEGHDNGVVFYGDNGTIEIGRTGCYMTRIGEEKTQIGAGTDFGANVRNFVDCVLAGTPDKLNAPISEAVTSAVLCHLGNIATRVDRKLHFDVEKWECTGDPQATALFSKAYRAGYELPGVNG